MGPIVLVDGCMQKLMTVKEVADILRVSNMTVYRLVKGGSLPAVRVGKNYRIKTNDVQAYIDREAQPEIGDV